MLWFRAPEKVYYKKGCLPVAMAELSDKKRAFIVTDTFLYQNGYTKPVEEELDAMGITHTVFYNVAPDPTLACAREGAEEMAAFRPDLIIAVGGGSAMDAAKILSEKYGLEADVINLHSLSPLDYTKIVESVRKTGRVVLVSDACARGSFTGEIAKNITEMCFDDLDAPPVVVGAKNWITPPFEFDEFFFPQASWILDAVHEKLVPLEGYTPENGVSVEEMLRRAKQGV